MYYATRSIVSSSFCLLILGFILGFPCPAPAELKTNSRDSFGQRDSCWCRSYTGLGVYDQTSQGYRSAVLNFLLMGFLTEHRMLYHPS